VNVSFGILAYNESDSIGTTLESLFQQSLFTEPDSSSAIEILVVPNGCTDETAEISRVTLDKLINQSAHPNVSWQVCEVEQPGKSNAWNRYVHDFSNPAADYLFLMDADIQFLEPHTLRNMIHALESTPEAWVSTDVPVKDVALKDKKNVIERLSVSVSPDVQSQERWAAICGQLYCARAGMLRKIWLPIGLPIEDGFVRMMVLTACFTSPINFYRVVLAKSASHKFEAYINLSRLLAHEKGRMMGNRIDNWIYSYLKSNCNQEQDAGSLIKRLNDENPLWLRQLIQKTIAEKDWWLLPQWYAFRRFKRLQGQPLQKLISKFPVTITAFLADLVVAFQVNQELHNTGGLGYYWGKKG